LPEQLSRNPRQNLELLMDQPSE